MNIDAEELKRTIKKHIWGPIGSVIFHVLVVVLLVVFAANPNTESAPEVEITMMETKADTLEKVDEVIKKELEQEKPPEDVQVERPDNATTSTMDVPDDAPGSGAGNSEGVGIGSGDPSLAAGFEVALAKSPLVMKGLYSTRTSAGRKGALSAFGGSMKGEAAVMRALRWLKANQDPDGSWTKVETGQHASWGPPSMASLALLCFLAHNETPSSPEFGATVEKAMKYIVAQQTESGSFDKTWRGENTHRVYQNGVCTYAMSEAFGLTKIMALKDAMDKGIKFILDGQQPGGGYDYGFAKGARFDLSVAGWQFQAMKAAKMAGCTNEKLEDAIKKSCQFLRTQAFVNNGFVYAPGSGPTPAMTSAGVLCLQLLGKPDVAEVRHGLKKIEDFEKAGTLKCVWDKDPKTKQPLYAWYYATQAKFQKGGQDWTDWNKKFSRMLIQSQMVEKDMGHWDGGDWGNKVYTTTLSCLMLEVYYRYLPTFKHVEATPEAPTAAKTDDVVVDVK